ncbi:cytochrome C oxidase subunit IV family protein [Jiulongibacter sediminis]|jgi:cytochrome c oxidase subunit IV|uniref:Membrane protein n=1 Tax=Jiulongibacter sediminis TaxID=1605367 RepID=A0A0N8H980_9BACT|nr:cytochrome C oxidase subunit IV family protein [Jiulongibacter sediminis]KPM46628.1 membrane protein [Jiulongibacter sediminis]TBX21486.1 membrane protein [Jiulongibacter sediminis]
MAAHIENTTGERQKPQTKALWRVFWILLIVTAVEFVIAFTISADSDFGKWFKIGTFIILTFVKSFYIVGTFMHLKDEVKSLIWSIVLPVIFVIWFLVALVLFEGGYIGTVR